MNSEYGLKTDKFWFSIVILSGLPKELCNVIFTFLNYNITVGDISASYNEIIGA